MNGKMEVGECVEEGVEVNAWMKKWRSGGGEVNVGGIDSSGLRMEGEGEIGPSTGSSWLGGLY